MTDNFDQTAESGEAVKYPVDLQGVLQGDSDQILEYILAQLPSDPDVVLDSNRDKFIES